MPFPIQEFYLGFEMRRPEVTTQMLSWFPPLLFCGKEATICGSKEITTSVTSTDESAKSHMLLLLSGGKILWCPCAWTCAQSGFCQKYFYNRYCIGSYNVLIKLLDLKCRWTKPARQGVFRSPNQARLELIWHHDWANISSCVTWTRQCVLISLPW